MSRLGPVVVSLVFVGDHILSWNPPFGCTGSTCTTDAKFITSTFTMIRTFMQGTFRSDRWRDR